MSAINVLVLIRSGLAAAFVIGVTPGAGWGRRVAVYFALVFAMGLSEEIAARR